jgi:hypothetical protein
MITMDPWPRSEALAAGSLFYATGKPCRHGHVGPRYLCNYNCVECSDQREAKRPKRHRVRYVRKCKTSFAFLQAHPA